MNTNHRKAGNSDGVVAGSLSELLTVDDVCAMLRITRSALYGLRYYRKGPPAIRIGRQLRFRRADVEAWLASQPAA